MSGAALISGAVVAPAWCIKSLASLILAPLTCHHKCLQWPSVSVVSPAKHPVSQAARGCCEPHTCPGFSAWSVERAEGSIGKSWCWDGNQSPKEAVLQPRVCRFGTRWSPDLGSVSLAVPR